MPSGACEPWSRRELRSERLARVAAAWDSSVMDARSGGRAVVAVVAGVFCAVLFGCGGKPEPLPSTASSAPDPWAGPARPASSAPAASTKEPPPSRTGVVVSSDHTRTLNDVEVREVALLRNANPMTIWIYRPARKAPTDRTPLVLIAGAGTPMFWGMELSDGDRAEHFPWVQRGYAVAAYSLDGGVSDTSNNAAIEVGISRFFSAHAGLDNARAALDFVLANEPDIDKTRVFAVGHSSAATLALRVGAQDPRIKATVAFAPVTDVEHHIGELFSRFNEEGRTILRDSSPMTFADKLRLKPVFLLNADDDSKIPTAEIERLVDAMKPPHPKSRYVSVPTGDHYDSMIATIPGAADWASHL